jgi:cobalamin synthase
MVRLDSMSPRPALVLGAFLPNYVIVVAAVSNVVQAGLPQARAAVVMLLFVVVASAGVAPLALAGHPAGGRRGLSEVARLADDTWQLLVLVVLAVVAVVLMAKGIVGLVT